MQQFLKRKPAIIKIAFLSLFVLIFRLSMPLLGIASLAAAQAFPESPTLAELASNAGCYARLQKRQSVQQDSTTTEFPALYSYHHTQNDANEHCILCHNISTRKFYYTLISQDAHPDPEINSSVVAYAGLAFIQRNFYNMLPARAPPAA